MAKLWGMLGVIVACAFVGVISFSGCGGSTTPPTDESVKLTGTFSEPGVDASNVSVALYALKATGGKEDAPLAQAFTDASGAYTLTLPDSVDVTTGDYLVVGFASEIARNVTGLTEQDVNPLTDAVSKYIDDLLGLGAAIGDVDVEMLQTLLAAAAGCDVNETPANIRACLLANESFVLAIANGFSATAEAKALVSSPFDVIGSVAAFKHNLECNEANPAGDPTGFIFDMTDAGEVDDGNNKSFSDAYDTAATLNIVNGDAFGGNTYFPARAIGDQAQARLEDVDGDATADQIVYLATTDGGLDVVRKIYVPQTFDCTLGGTIEFSSCGWARYLDCFSNATGSAVTLDLSFDSNLGSDGSELFVGAFFGEAMAYPYYWATKEDGSDPQVGFVLDEEDAAVRASIVTFGGEDVLHSYLTQSIEDGERACYLYYLALGDRATPEGDIMGLLKYLFTTSPRTGILPREDQDIRNFKSRLYSMNAPVASVPPNSSVTVTNTTTNETETLTADEYGKFKSIVGCSAGETLEAVSAVGGVTISGTCS